MPRLKEAEEIDVEELDVEWTEGQFVKYDGEIPPTGTVLNGQVTKMWWTYSGDNTAMLKVLWVADDTAGEYEGLPAWENMVLKPSAAFKYGPFLQYFGLTLKDVKSKTYVAEDDDKNGAPITKIGSFEPGSEEAYCAIEVSRERYNMNWQAHVGAWLDYDDDLTVEETEEEEEPPARPARASRTATRKPAETAKPAATRGRRKPAEEEPEDDEEGEEEEATAAPAARGRSRATAGRTAAPARSASAKPAQSKPAARGRGRRTPQGSTDDPPF